MKLTQFVPEIKIQPSNNIIQSNGHLLRILKENYKEFVGFVITKFEDKYNLVEKWKEENEPDEGWPKRKLSGHYNDSAEDYNEEFYGVLQNVIDDFQYKKPDSILRLVRDDDEDYIEFYISKGDFIAFSIKPIDNLDKPIKFKDIQLYYETF